MNCFSSEGARARVGAATDLWITRIWALLDRNPLSRIRDIRGAGSAVIQLDLEATLEIFAAIVIAGVLGLPMMGEWRRKSRR